MKKKFSTFIFTLVISTNISANGYYAFNHSSQSFALAGAYQSQAKTADAAYYNPANLVWIKNPQSLIQFDAILAHQERQAFTGSVNLPTPETDASGNQDPINAFMPYGFYVSPQYNHWRWGISTTYQGVSSNWKNQPQALLIGKASAASVFINPVISYELNEQWAVGAGIQMNYSMLEQQAKGNLLGSDIHLHLDTKGASLSPNIALSYRPTEKLSFSAHYRFSTKTKLMGKAKISDGIDNYDGKVELNMLTPASLKLSSAYEFKNTLLELAFSRIYWGELSTSQLKLDRDLTGISALFQAEAIKDWRDTDTIYLGISQKLNSQTTLLLGLSQDLGTAVPEKNLNFDWLDSKVTTYGLGLTYQYKPNLTLGTAYNFANYEKVNVKNDFLTGSYARNVHVISFSLTNNF
ncbi:OmpP1/FadL family transporter [Thiomicrorhabdus sp. Milos-T2]|uniref:OmpP1/FadL family transporter n=1 Tax=Thiomicrorhabdus sp. Milos-T2 TaxID=90814 RepID=UPI000493BC8D|nr:outer membrane protein transport protein [Thiomicrorhabdus sp. Milos-T2]